MKHVCVSLASMNINKRNIRYLLILAQVLFWVVIIWGSYPLQTRLEADGVERVPLITLLWFCLPFILLININWYFIAPRFLKRGSYGSYGLYVAGSIIFCSIILAFNPIVVEQVDMWLIMGESGRKLLVPRILTMMYILTVTYLLSMPFYLSLGWFDQQSKIDKLESENLRSELNVLKNQVNPHFFFNTLNSLYSLSLKKSEKAPEIILKLSELMRYVIYDANKPLVPIQEEVEYLESYFQIQKLRLSSNVKVAFHWQVDDPSTGIVPLLFINLLENAFKHGTDSMVSSGMVNCTLQLEKDQLTFRLKNRYEKAIKEKDEKVGLGLQNLKRRLNLAYPKCHTLSISDENGTFDVLLTIEKTDELPHS